MVKNAHSLTSTVENHHSPPIHRYISEMVEDRWVHAARRLTSIEFFFDPCNIYRDGPRSVDYPADVRSVGDSHPSSFSSISRGNKTLKNRRLSLIILTFADLNSFIKTRVITKSKVLMLLCKSDLINV